MPSRQLDFPVFDADNHMYETRDALTRHLGQAAARVPPSRRHLRPRARHIVLELAGSITLRGSVEVGDGRSPPFSVGFTLRKGASGWRVVSASPPG